MDPSDPSKLRLPPPPSIPAPAAPSIPKPTVQVQSLTPTGGTGTVHVVAPAPSSAVPRPSVAQEVGTIEEGGGEPVYVHEPLPPPAKRNMLVEYWRKVGAGSFLLSILIHIG